MVLVPITDEELMQGPTFPVAWARFVEFAEGLVAIEIHASSESEGDESNPRPPRPPDEPPDVLLVAHNGERFDFAMLLCECSRHGVSWAPLERWYFVDPLWVHRARTPAGECLKLQCMARCICSTTGLHAHRALDDCFCLRITVEHTATRLGMKHFLKLLQPFAVQLESGAATTQVSALLSLDA